jgi:Arylsulfotransferase (ASST)
MWHPSRLDSAGATGAPRGSVPHSHMRRNVLIILGTAVLAWGVLALALGSPSLKLGAGSRAHSRVSPACLPATLARSAALPGTSVDVSPAPETASANPHTQISFLGLPSAQIREVSVVGQRSGRHSGRLRAYSQGDGASFAPDAPFRTGERVSVSALIGTGAGARRASFAFRVDTPYPTAAVTGFANAQAAPADYQSFYTLPGAQPPIMHVSVADRDPAAGDILTTNGPGPGQYGPLIYTPGGRLVWFDRLTGGQTAENLSEQTYEDRPVLTWWRGRVLSLGFGQGEDLVMDSRYRTVARVPGGNGLKADLHDFQLAPHGVAYITAYNPIRCELTSAGGTRDGAIVDTAIQQLDIRTGLVRWEWHSLDHIGAAESEVQAPSDSTPWDYFHLNSIDREPDGNILISARSTWAGYLLAGGSGQVLWRLGGNHSSFKMGPGTQMAWQHDARLLPGGELSFFDDGSNPPIHRQSRAVRIALDLKTMRARLVLAYTHHDPPLLAASQGNMQTLPDGNTLVGYGAVPAISEYASDGALLFDANQPYDMTFYRAFRFPWSARPLTPPAVLASLNDTGEETVVHASWNGATGVSSWRVLAGAGRASLTAQAVIPATGFESSTTLPRKYAYVAVQALDSAGRVLGTSSAVKTISFAAALPRSGGSR